MLTTLANNSLLIKGKTKKYYTVSKSNRKIVEIDEIDSPDTQIHKITAHSHGSVWSLQ